MTELKSKGWIWGPIAWIHTDWGFWEPCWRDIKTGELTCANNRCDGGASRPGFTRCLDQPAAGQVLRRGCRVSPVSSPLPYTFLLSSFGVFFCLSPFFLSSPSRWRFPSCCLISIFLSFSLLSFLTQPPVGFRLAVFLFFFLSFSLLSFITQPSAVFVLVVFFLFFLSSFSLLSFITQPLWVFFLLSSFYFFFLSPHFLSSPSPCGFSSCCLFPFFPYLSPFFRHPASCGFPSCCLLSIFLRIFSFRSFFLPLPIPLWDFSSCCFLSFLLLKKHQKTHCMFPSCCLLSFPSFFISLVIQPTAVFPLSVWLSYYLSHFFFLSFLFCFVVVVSCLSLFLSFLISCPFFLFRPKEHLKHFWQPLISMVRIGVLTLPMFCWV